MGYWSQGIGAWRSLVARTVRVGEVPGSNPGAPIFRRSANSREYGRKAAETLGLRGIREYSAMFEGFAPQRDRSGWRNGSQNPQACPVERNCQSRVSARSSTWRPSAGRGGLRRAVPADRAGRALRSHDRAGHPDRPVLAWLEHEVRTATSMHSFPERPSLREMVA
jgi:hypothetical protein